MLATVADRHVHRSTCKVNSAAATHKSNEVAIFVCSGCENPAFLVSQASLSQHAMHIACSVLSFGYCFLFRAFSGVGMLSAEIYYFTNEEGNEANQQRKKDENQA